MNTKAALTIWLLEIAAFLSGCRGITRAAETPASIIPGTPTVPIAVPLLPAQEVEEIATLPATDGNVPLTPIASGTIIRAIEPSSTVNPAPRSTPGRSPKVKFVSGRNGLMDVYMISADGTDIEKITHSNIAKFVPKWSPQADKLAFLSGDDMYHTDAIYVIDNDLEANEKLLAKFDGIIDFTWSPDGEYIALVANDESQRWGLYTMSADGSELTALLPNYSYELGGVAWSPDGHSIAVATATEKPQHSRADVTISWGILVVSLDGAGNRLVNGDISLEGFSWLPAGNQILFTSPAWLDGQIYLASLDNTDSQSIRPVMISLASDQVCGGAYPSPDSKRMLVHSLNKLKFADELYVADIDGTDAVKIFSADSSLVFPSWSPDSEQIAFLLPAKGRDLQALGQLYVVNADGTDLRLLDESAVMTPPSWQP